MRQRPRRAPTSFAFCAIARGETLLQHVAPLHSVIRLCGAPVPLGSSAFLGAPTARPLQRFSGSLVSTAGPRAHPLPARCGTQFNSRPRESLRRLPGRLRIRDFAERHRLAPAANHRRKHERLRAAPRRRQHDGDAHPHARFFFEAPSSDEHRGEARIAALRCPQLEDVHSMPAPKSRSGLSAKSVHRRREHFPRRFTEPPIQTEKDFLSAEERHSPRRPDGSDGGHSHGRSDQANRGIQRRGADCYSNRVGTATTVNASPSLHKRTSPRTPECWRLGITRSEA